MVLSRRIRCAAVSLGALLLPALVGCSSAVSALSGPTFAVGGNATKALSPGRSTPLNVRITNPHPFPLSIHDLEVAVSVIDAPLADEAHRCDSGDFAVRQLANDVAITIPPNATRRLSELHLTRDSWPRIAMTKSKVDQDACRGVALTLAYSASAGMVTQ